MSAQPHPPLSRPLPPRPRPRVRAVSVADLGEALRDGWGDDAHGEATVRTVLGFDDTSGIQETPALPDDPWKPSTGDDTVANDTAPVDPDTFDAPWLKPSPSKQAIQIARTTPRFVVYVAKALFAWAKTTLPSALARAHVELRAAWSRAKADTMKG